MVSINCSTIVEAPINKVWEILRDFNGHEKWHPSVEKSNIDNGKGYSQIGSIRNFKLIGGERIREQLLSMSDTDFSLRYTIIESDISLFNYVAQIQLKPVTDADWTFWLWNSEFETPMGKENELSNLVANGIYELGFQSFKSKYSTNKNVHLVSNQKSLESSIEGSAIVLDRYGDPNQLQFSKTKAPAPGPNQVRLRQTAIGVNFIDIYCRTGYFNLLSPPGILGMEAAGEVIDKGSDVTHLNVGQRVAYACPPLGAYSTVRTMNAELVVPLPDFIDNVTAAACMLKGITAEFLLHDVHSLKTGETVLIYAPAGGVGQILCQLAKHIGATVIGATSSREKADIAKSVGVDHVILPSKMNLEDQVRDLTDGVGVNVIFDAVGRDSFSHSLKALAPCGHFISYGQASGDIGKKDISSLSSSSATLSRPNYVRYTDTKEKVSAITKRLFEAIERKIVNIKIGQKYSLSDAAKAHRDMESRKTTASSVLICEEHMSRI